MDDGVACQLIPVFFVLALFVLNLFRKRCLFCISSLSLLCNLLAMIGAVFMYFDPRSGVPYTSCEAMIFFSICFTIICLPAIAYKDGCLSQGIPAGICDLMDERKLVLIARVVAPLTFFSFCYFLIDTMPHFRAFLSGVLSREDFRAGIDVSHTASPLVAIVSLLGTLSFVSLFLGIVIYLFIPHHRMLSLFLLLGGLTYAVNMLKNASRSGIAEVLLFSFSAASVLWSRVPLKECVRIKRIGILVGMIILVPFTLITVVRFGSGNYEHGVLYSLGSYFSTGPYSFNVDYTVRSEYDTPTLGGFLTCSFIPMVLDKVTGTSGRFEEAQAIMDDLHEGLNEYKLISEAYSGEFKTIVGSFLLDYPSSVVPFIFLVTSILLIVLLRSTSKSLSHYVWASIYFYCLFMAPIGFGFAARYMHLILLGLIVLSVVLQFTSRASSFTAKLIENSVSPMIP